MLTQLRQQGRSHCVFTLEPRLDHACKRCAAQVLDVKLPFDEVQLLRDNTEFLLRSLKLTALDVQHAESGLPPDSVTAPGAEERVRDAVPGSPAVLFSMLTQRDDGTTMTLLR